MVEYCMNLQDDKVIIVAPEPIDTELVYRKRKENPFTHIVLTSGSMLNLKLYQKNGPSGKIFYRLCGHRILPQSKTKWSYCDNPKSCYDGT